MAKNLADYEELGNEEPVIVAEDEEEEEEEDWGDWNADEEEGDNESDSELLCLFCDSKYNATEELFEHCKVTHYFDFHGIRKTLGLDFYACFKLINYVRSQVAESSCWSCKLICQSKLVLQSHLHEASSFKDTMLPWDNDKYLKPFMQDDPLLYSFAEDHDVEVEEENVTSVDKVEDLINFERICIDDDSSLGGELYNFQTQENGRKEIPSTSNSCLNNKNPSQEAKISSADAEVACCADRKPKDKNLRVSFAKVVENDIKNVNKNYFGSYSSFAIHREMISDKVRTDAYRQAILNNPSLFHGASVMDVGCGTGILSLFAAQAGASSVTAVEASDKMAAVATQIVKDNGFLWHKSSNEAVSQCTGIIRVVQGMVEELDSSKHVQPHSIDMLLSEWMGYCLLYESMLSSVLFARDRWLKPGGAILPDTATMFVAGFGRGGTSIPFWENVYGFNMSCIGKELVEDAAQIPIVDVLDSSDIVTNTAILQSFDLMGMTPDDMDFTSRIELEPQFENQDNFSGSTCKTWCYGVVLWFETGFTSRFCKEMPVILSTSPYTPKTHWSQTILSFKEPIAMAMGKTSTDRSAAVGTDACPAMRIQSRISIARASQHRSIDISLEIVGIDALGRKRRWPVQIFNLA
ncbi:Histone-arginine N-methyltransferase [Bertholletia excelsa]